MIDNLKIHQINDKTINELVEMGNIDPLLMILSKHNLTEYLLKRIYVIDDIKDLEELKNAYKPLEELREAFKLLEEYVR